MDYRNKKHDLLACIAPVVRGMLPLLLKGTKLPEESLFRKNIAECFDAFEKKCQEQNIPLEETNQAKFALAATCDEFVLSPEANIEFRESWMQNKLSVEYSGVSKSGEVFFERLDEFCRNLNKYHNLIEVYYFCLELGFKGIYVVKGIEKHKALMISISNNLEGAEKLETRLSDNGTPPEGITKKVGRVLPSWVIGSIGVGAIILLVTIFQFLAYSQANDSITKLRMELNVLYANAVGESDGG